MKAKDILGRRGEDLATEFLLGLGYSILERNWRCPQGEIDVVAEHLGVTVFVEVKTRSGLRFGHPFEAITLHKMRRLHRLSFAWCEAAAQVAADMRAGEASDASGIVTRTPPLARRQIRIDAIGVLAPRGLPVSIEHMIGIF